jgi:hypothetical protein
MLWHKVPIGNTLLKTPIDKTSAGLVLQPNALARSAHDNLYGSTLVETPKGLMNTRDA